MLECSILFPGKMSSRTRKIMNLVQMNNSAKRNCLSRPDPPKIVTGNYVVSSDGTLDRVNDDMSQKSEDAVPQPQPLEYTNLIEEKKKTIQIETCNGIIYVEEPGNNDRYLHTNDTVLEKSNEVETADRHSTFGLGENPSIGLEELEELRRNPHFVLIHVPEEMENAGRDTDFGSVEDPCIIENNEETEDEVGEKFENVKEAVEGKEEQKQSEDPYSDSRGGTEMGKKYKQIKNAENDSDFEPESSDEEGEIILKKRTHLKRGDKLETKLKRVRGKGYEGYRRNKEKHITRTPREARHLKARCNHKTIEIEKIRKKSFLCASLTDEDRQDIFRRLWKLDTWNEKKTIYPKSRCHQTNSQTKKRHKK